MLYKLFAEMRVNCVPITGNVVIDVLKLFENVSSLKDNLKMNQLIYKLHKCCFSWISQISNLTADNVNYYSGEYKCRMEGDNGRNHNVQLSLKASQLIQYVRS